MDNDSELKYSCGPLKKGKKEQNTRNEREDVDGCYDSYSSSMNKTLH